MPQIEVIEQRKQDLIAAAAGSDSDSDREDPNETNTETAPAVVERRVTLNANPAQNIDDLKKRLAARLAGFQSKRKYDDEKSDAHNKAKAKEIREQRKKKKSEDQKKGITAPSADRPSRVHMTTGGEETGEGKSSQQIVYSKFDFSALEKEKKKKAKKSNDLKMLLEKAESEKKAMEDLKQADPAKAKDIEEKRRQKKALEMAQGIKQQDDPTLLRKALKKKEQKKLKSAKTWNDSIKAVKHNIKRNEAKRDANLKARVDAKKEKKIARGQGKKVKSKKPPPKRAGFEGKSKNPTKSGKSKK
ncbi:hypothetical protein SARC_07446 [Sphaeroforma arctica JP610]|uniref:Ribosomal RNA-processing protein 14/surfeit locus protein 6 C-terminal domain-containing protein n=1 Tax=Sphaeroforma arctica JP610 TaxID=667725 RepID=A0A0L0FTP2_9EUKA|nr:hypothetical protein SARC_07446 [Sphaeroforma arctica JP610]KNC80185.1 hypothetical protein SARC_07446 [Sphaeroforma arctica JP610]|eukprot:XP_014154087.1 hypothetical protein SARC_07446 [Sphaeroforma arctica JP610]